MRQIPRNRLPHTIIRNEYISTSPRTPTYGANKTIQFVKIDETTRLLKTRDGKEIVGNGMMFYDFVNSSPSKIVFNKQDKITFNGKVYHIAHIDTLYGNSDIPHHYEIILI